ncbi:unnamed protein product [Allacma fusca]|uniref:Mitochondrial proton/calcium exchanger protein n=1 Tax=Allacma fusca TaxID=39272 RepID=A0A8J2L8P7_9HEXA|nr:unnamed protein product [Allacma fusca]
MIWCSSAIFQLHLLARSLIEKCSGQTRMISLRNRNEFSALLLSAPSRRSQILDSLVYPQVQPCRTGVVGIQNHVFPRASHSVHIRFLHSSQSYGGDKEPNKPSSKVEESVNAIKEERETSLAQPPKRTLWKKIEDEILHYYHGFRLLFIDIRIAFGLVKQILNGKSLSRREHRQLVRTTSDVFRLLPFSVFIIVPFMELLLPVFLKLFPGMLPSTFQTKNEKEAQLVKSELKVKLEMAKFLQQTLDDMAVSGKGRSSQKAKEFAGFISKIRTSGGEVSNEDIMKFSKLFEDEITLDSLNRSQLTALCHLLEISTIGTTALLKFQLRLRLRSLAADDRTIEQEGVDSMNQTELQQACKARGMRSLGVSESRLRRQLKSWLELSLNQKVPPSLLLLSRAMYLPENLPATAQLQATISALPDAAATQAKAAIGEREGKVDNKTRIEIIREEERRIKEEKMEFLEDTKVKPTEDIELKADDEPLAGDADKPKGPKVEHPVTVELLPTLTALLGPEILRHSTAKTVQETIERRLTKHVPHPLADMQKDPLTAEDIERIENALDVLGSQKRELYIETEELQDLKEELADYQDDLKDLDTISKESKVVESKAAKRLYKRVNSLIGNLEQVVDKLQKEGHELKAEIKEGEAREEVQDLQKTKLISIQELIEAIQSIQSVSDPAKIERITDVLENMDYDRDGRLEVDAVLKVIELIGRENVKLNPNQVAEIVNILEKEESLGLSKSDKGLAKIKPKKDLN